MSYFDCLESSYSINLLNFLAANIQWGTGIQTRYGNTTRFQQYYAVCTEEVQQTVLYAIDQGMKKMGFSVESVQISGIYLNYYRDGKDFYPKHRHFDTNQMVLSLGSTRRLFIGDNFFDLETGSAVFFGDQTHWINSQKSVIGERISIVVFFN